MIVKSRVPGSRFALVPHRASPVMGSIIEDYDAEEQIPDTGHQMPDA
jgi:hypothetical protein